MTARAHIDSPALLIITSLRHVARKLADGDEHEQTAAGFIELVLSGASLDEVLGTPAPGQRSVTTQLAIAARDQLLRDAASRFFPDLPLAAQARELAGALTRYAASAWMRERAETSCPARHHGRIEAVCWQVLKHRDLVLTPRRFPARRRPARGARPRGGELIFVEERHLLAGAAGLPNSGKLPSVPLEAQSFS
jgi:hypothetical protein